MLIPYYLLEMPSFSLRLSQEDASVDTEPAKPINYVLPATDSVVEVAETRRSKRPRTTPAGLHDYKCELKSTSGLAIMPDIDMHFTLMEEAANLES